MFGFHPQSHQEPNDLSNNGFILHSAERDAKVWGRIRLHCASLYSIEALAR